MFSLFVDMDDVAYFCSFNGYIWKNSCDMEISSRLQRKSVTSLIKYYTFFIEIKKMLLSKLQTCYRKCMESILKLECACRKWDDDILGYKYYILV